MYRAGDYVYPADLPRRVLCRVATADSAVTAAGAFQILTLEPLEVPWQSRLGDRLVRFDEAVRPALSGDGASQHVAARNLRDPPRSREQLSLRSFPCSRRSEHDEVQSHLFSLAAGPHPRRELTPTPRVGFTVLRSVWPQALMPGGLGSSFSS